jgi:hypothetical protein
MKKRLLFLLSFVLISANFVHAQNAAPEVTVTLNEQFLNSFLDAVFTNLDTPTFDLSEVESSKPRVETVKYENRKCAESVTLLRELNKVRTAVKFVNGQIVAPIAFVGKYDVPFVGCTEFSGVALANLNLFYDRERQTLVGRVKVSKVDLNGVIGLASGVIGRFVQGAIDKKVNPLEILRAEQISAVVPVQYAKGAIKLKAVDMKPEVAGNALNVRVAFEFAKAP